MNAKELLTFDPICTIHGQRMSEHTCLYCCLCFTTLTPDQCAINKGGEKENVCSECAVAERDIMQAKNADYKPPTVVEVGLIILLYGEFEI